MVDYKEVLTDLRHRKAQLREELAQLDVAIAAIEKMVPTQQLFVGSSRNEAKDYVGLTIREAAKRCLETHGKPMKTKELADALLSGGFQTNAQNFSTTVYGTLTRDEETFYVKDGVWSLRAWKS